MSDGNTGAGLIYIGTNGSGSQYEGLYNNTYWDLDASSSDSTIDARASYCVHIHGSLATINHQITIRNALCRRASVANIYNLGSSYFVIYDNVYSAWSPIGFQEDSAGSTSFGPTEYRSCYAIQCLTGYQLSTSGPVVGNAVGCDQCTTGLSVISSTSVTINGWSCEGTRSPLFASYSQVKISGVSALIKVGTAATYSASSWSGQAAPPAVAAGSYVYELQGADLIVDSAMYNIEIGRAHV